MREELRIAAEYYSQKVRDFGATPKGVDWNGEDSQFNRFAQLSRVFNDFKGSCADVGCGYGAYLEYLDAINASEIKYSGYDLSKEMIDAAKEAHPSYSDQFHLINSIKEIPVVDYAVASGIYNVRQDIGDEKWKSYIFESLQEMNSICTKGFAFNVLTSYSDADKKRDYLYYASPEDFFKFCKTEFSRNVALLHDYDLYEFTIVVKK